MKRKIILWLLGLLGEYKTQKTVVIIEIDATQAIKTLNKLQKQADDLHKALEKIIK